jgi:hypothetical protein
MNSSRSVKGQRRRRRVDNVVNDFGGFQVVANAPRVPNPFIDTRSEGEHVGSVSTSPVRRTDTGTVHSAAVFDRPFDTRRQRQVSMDAEIGRFATTFTIDHCDEGRPRGVRRGRG